MKKIFKKMGKIVLPATVACSVISSVLPIAEQKVFASATHFLNGVPRELGLPHVPEGVNLTPAEFLLQRIVQPETISGSVTAAEFAIWRDEGLAQKVIDWLDNYGARPVEVGRPIERISYINHANREKITIGKINENQFRVWSPLRGETLISSEPGLSELRSFFKAGDPSKYRFTVAAQFPAPFPGDSTATGFQDNYFQYNRDTGELLFTGSTTWPQYYW